jgi:hypothetical protein
MKISTRLHRWISKHREELHNIFDAAMFGVGMVFVGLGAALMALWVIGDLDLGVLGTGVAAMFIGGFDIRLSLAPWKKKERK